MRVRFDYPMGGDGFGLTLDMPAVPQQGDQVVLPTDDDSEREFTVRRVSWTPQDPDRWDAYVVLRD